MWEIPLAVTVATAFQLLQKFLPKASFPPHCPHKTWTQESQTGRDAFCDVDKQNLTPQRFRLWSQSQNQHVFDSRGRWRLSAMTSVGKCSCAQINSTWPPWGVQAVSTKPPITVSGVQETTCETMESFEMLPVLAEGDRAVQTRQWLRVRVRSEELVHSEENLSNASLCMTHRALKRFSQSHRSLCDARLRGKKIVGLVKHLVIYREEETVSWIPKKSKKRIS